jgi:protein-S-isoprenylcysteine O-methyltransferase Ste14
VSAQSPGVVWYFRYRVFLITAAYAIGFFAGDLLMPRSGASFERLGALTPAWFGARGMLGVVVLLTLAGALWRIWGASYLSSAVVHAWDVQTGALYVAGPYRFTRNPLYLGNLFWALGIGLYGTPLATLLVFVLNLWVVELLIGAEEKAMLERFGSRFLEYRNEVPRLVPLWFRAAPPEPGIRPDWGQGVRSELFGLAFVGVTFASYLAQRPTAMLFGVCALLLIVAGFARGRPKRPSEARPSRT